MTLMKCMSVVLRDSLRYGHFMRDLCSIQDYSCTCILTSTELSFLVEYMHYIMHLFLTVIKFICFVIIIVFIIAL